MLLVLVALLVWVRNLYGLLVLVVGGAGLLLLTWYGGETASSRSRPTSSPGCCCWRRPVRWSSSWPSGRRRRRTSDADQLAGLTHLPAVVWMLLLLAANLAGLVVGVSMLAPELVEAAG